MVLIGRLMYHSHDADPKDDHKDRYSHRNVLEASFVPDEFNKAHKWNDEKLADLCKIEHEIVPLESFYTVLAISSLPDRIQQY